MTSMLASANRGKKIDISSSQWPAAAAVSVVLLPGALMENSAYPESPSARHMMTDVHFSKYMHEPYYITRVHTMVSL